MRNKKVSWLAYVLVAGVVALLVWYKFYEAPEALPKAGSGTAGPPPTTVKAQIIKYSTFDNLIAATGTLVANQEVSLNSEAAGKIVRLDLQEGSAVQQGQLLVKLNDADLQAQLSKLKARLKEFETRDQRQKTLFEKGAISQQEYDLFSTEKQGVEADIALVKAQIAKTEIRAPFAGKVGLRYVSLGAYVTQNARIAELVNADPMLVDFSIPERYAGLVARGGSITVNVENQPDSLEARIIAVAPRIDVATRTLQLRAQLPNKNNQLVAGAFAKVSIRLKQFDESLLIPTRSVIPEQNAKKVFLVKNGVVSPVYIETGQRSADLIRVTKGLSVGDTLITAGILKVRPGQPVQLLEIE